MDVRVFLLLVLFNFAQCAVWDLSCEQIKVLVDGHNNRRLRLVKGEVPNQPPADTMNSMVWDEELAAHAKDWASNYVEENGNAASKSFSGRFKSVWTITESLPVGIPDYTFNLDEILEGWFENYKNYIYGPGENNIQSGLYTQMVWSNSIYLGCGASEEFKGPGKILRLVCHYGPGGNIDGEFPYKALLFRIARGDAKLECPIEDCSHRYGSKCF